MTGAEARREIDSISDLLRRYQHEYYILHLPSVSDREYDRLFDKLLELEEQFPDLSSPDSPSRRIGSDLVSDLPEVRHSIPVLSLDKAYSHEGVIAWIDKIQAQSDENVSFVVEEKIDGVSIVLYYEAGRLSRAVTRGNGSVGNDVTENVKTIGAVPLRLPESISLAVRGEIYLPGDRFEALNRTMEVPYANPRNLAAGTLRRKKSVEAAAIPLTMFAYEGFIPEATTHLETLRRMSLLGFRLNHRIGYFCSEAVAGGIDLGFGPVDCRDFESIPGFIADRARDRGSLPYEIDGLVLKVNELPLRERLGYTGHHPRWAMAFKFGSPEGITHVRSIDVQVGRTGRITPVARVEPVLIGGSTVSNVTLHNQDYIDLLELAIGDSVAISKRGDVIPAVERVVEKNEDGFSTWKMPRGCPSCGEGLVIDGAHLFCRNRACPDQILGRLFFFVGRNQMDIENLGPETIETLVKEGMLRKVEDIYTCDYDSLADLPGFGPRKIELIKNGVATSKGQPFHRVLPSLGLPDLGQKVAELLINAGYRTVDVLLDLVDRGDTEALVAIPGIGEKTASAIVEELADPEVRTSIHALGQAGLQFEEPETTAEAVGTSMAGQVWCVTGSFDRYKPRTAAMDEVRRRGGSVTSQVSAKTTHLLAGSGGGSKLAKAGELGVTIVTEDEFVSLLEEET